MQKITANRVSVVESDVSIFQRASAYMQSALYAIARPSVRPSVCPLHGWISQKRLKLGLCNFHHRVAQSL